MFPLECLKTHGNIKTTIGAQMHLDLGVKRQIDSGYLRPRTTSDGRMIGSRARHVTWLHTYHVRGIIDHYQFHAGYKLGYLWNRVYGSERMPRMRFNDLPRAILSEFGDNSTSVDLRDAIAAIKRSNELEAVIDLSVFDMCMGKRRIQHARDGLDYLAAHFREQRNG